LQEAFGDAYDLIGAYWARYILDYEFEFSLKWVQPFVVVVSGLLILAGLCLLRQRRSRHSLTARQRLSRIYLELEDDLVHRAGVYPEAAFRDLPEARSWKSRYTRLRFGRREPDVKDLERINREAKHVLARAFPEPKTVA